MTQQQPSSRHTDSVVIVTGSTRGIGAEITRRFALEGANVVICGRSESDGEQVAASIREHGGEGAFIRVDLRDPDDIIALVTGTVERYGQLDVLVNNAAVQTETTAEELTLEEWDRVLETNFRSYWLTAKHAVDHMDQGSIINISSNHASLTMPAHFPYNAVKSGINGMTRAMALDFGPAIRVNTINPGWIAVKRTIAELGEEERRELEAKHPIGRIGEPEDVAGVATFLASNDAAFITGASLLVDGGRSSVMQDDTLPDYRDGR